MMRFTKVSVFKAGGVARHHYDRREEGRFEGYKVTYAGSSGVGVPARVQQWPDCLPLVTDHEDCAIAAIEMTPIAGEAFGYGLLVSDAAGVRDISLDEANARFAGREIIRFTWPLLYKLTSFASFTDQDGRVHELHYHSRLRRNYASLEVHFADAILVLLVFNEHEHWHWHDIYLRCYQLDTHGSLHPDYL